MSLLPPQVRSIRADAGYTMSDLTPTEQAIVATTRDMYRERTAILRALRVYQNADKVLAVLRLFHPGKIPVQASYTLYPIICNIGERTPEQYVVDVNCAVAAFNAMWQRYFEGEITLAQWTAYLWRDTL